MGHVGDNLYATALDQRDRLMLLVADDAGAADGFIRAVAAVSNRTPTMIGFADAARSLSNQARMTAILVDTVGVAEPIALETLARIDAVARERGVPVVASFAADQIDMVAAQLTWEQVQMLCEPDEAARFGAVALAVPAGSSATMLHEAHRDAEQRRLQQLHEEVARIAETLARLARGTQPAGATVMRDRANSFSAQPPAVETDDIDPGEVRAAIRTRRLRDQYFDAELFADPAWDMLLDLFAAYLERGRVSVSSLCIAAAVPPTTALRWIGTMREAGLFERQDDPFDRRRTFIGLSATAAAAMRNYMLAAKKAGLGIA